jgi:hypothetical protein
MRWDALFADFEAQLEAAEAADLATEVADRTRREHAAVRLLDRLAAAAGGTVRMHVVGVGSITGRIERSGPGWALLVDEADREVVVSLDAVTGVYGLPGAAARLPAVAARLGLGHVLRALARDRATVGVVLVDGATATGTIDRVGADFFDLTEHGYAEARRRDDVRAVRVVPFSGFAAARRA